MKVKVKILNGMDSMPQRAHDTDVGYDLKSAETFTLWPGERRLVGTGFAIGMESDLVALVHPRSGLAHKNGVTVLNAPGTIDSGYTGEIKVNLINLGDAAVHVKTGDKIAQLLFQKVEHPTFNVVHELSRTDRGENGHGSTG